MPTLRHAADLLRAAASHQGRLGIARLVGFAGEEVQLDRRARQRLGLPEAARHATLLEGVGSLRVLLLDADASPDARQLLTQLAVVLHGRAPQVLWLVIASVEDGARVLIGAWFPGERTRRVVALVAQHSNIVASDAETLLSLAAVGHGDDLLIHTRWCELLGREAMSRRFFHLLSDRVRLLGNSLAGVPRADRSELALLYSSRLLFLSFLQTKGWLDGDHGFLSTRFDQCLASGGHFHQRVLLPLFFGTLNTRIRDRAPTARALGAIPFLNGGLFARTALERRHRHSRFPDDAFGALFSDVLSAFRFTARETAREWMEASIDPEMLGRAFESLMAGQERKATGTFYTPQELVQHVTDRALELSLASGRLSEECVAAALRGERMRSADATALRAALSTFTVLDPACGSGAFLVHVLERTAALQQAAGDMRDIALIRREFLGRAIHGVDINPTAVWLCELRLWLSVVIESEETRMSAVPPLPNLDCNIRVGDALAGAGFESHGTLMGPSAAFARLHARYVRASGPGKLTLRRDLQREERKRSLVAIDREMNALREHRRERARAQRARDLFGGRSAPSAAELEEMRATRVRANSLRRERQRIADGGALPFSFPSHFGDAHARGGFQLVVGNPPWVRVHNIPAAQRTALRERYSVYQSAPWQPSEMEGRRRSGFASQVDLSSLFVERSADLVAQGGSIALLLPSKLWQSLAGGGLRELIGTRLQLRGLEDWSAAPASFDAAVYPSVILAQRSSLQGDARALVHRRKTVKCWHTDASALRFDRGDAASPFLLLPPRARAVFEDIRHRGTPLSSTRIGKPVLGVKCGHNDAFILHCAGEHGNHVSVEQHGRDGAVERSLVRPLLRGDGVTPWTIERSDESILWTHDDAGRPLTALPEGAARWLSPWRRQLMRRTDLHSNPKWWALFRTEGAQCSSTRVVWSDFGRRPRAAVLHAGDRTVPINTCYVLPCAHEDDALALCAILNSPLAAAWLNVIAEPARGGWRRYLAWTVSLLPLPRHWTDVRETLAALTRSALRGTVPPDSLLLERVAESYGVKVHDVEALLEWSNIPPGC